jgi:3-dehydroquinate synthase
MSQICQIIVESRSDASPLRTGAAFDWGDQLPQTAGLLGENPGLKMQGPVDLRTLSLEIFERPNVLAILVSAFSRGLTRDTAWNLDGVCDTELPCYIEAARVYKRGVATTKNQIITQTHRPQAPAFNVDQSVANYFSKKLPATSLIMKFSEAGKNIHTLADVMSKIRKHRQTTDGKDFVVRVVGGGIAGDIVGMAAGLLGLKTHYVPTTLLAMVDSSVGGKVGVNFEPWGKNQIGLFHDPIGVSVCLAWLETLPEDEFRAGLAEGLKHALLIGDLDLWKQLIDCATKDFSSITPDILSKVIQVKVDVVSRDPLEHGERAILNFGHTLAHVIEAMAIKKNHKILHGECVAVGMVHALIISKKYFEMHADPLVEDLLRSRILPSKERLAGIFGPISDFDKNRNDILKLLMADKKAKADSAVRFVLLKAPGHVARGAGGEWAVLLNTDEVWRDVCETLGALTEKIEPLRK